MPKKKRKSTPPPSIKRSVAARRKRRRTVITRVMKETRETNPARRRNQALVGGDIVQVILPAFGGFAVTKVIQRIVYSIVQKRWPRFGKHAHALSGLAAFGAAWFGAGRIKAIAKYSDGAVIGSGLAALHGLATCYVPAKYNWLLADCRPADVGQLPAGTAAAQVTTVTSSGAPVGDEYDILEAELDVIQGRRGRAAQPRAQAPAPQQQAAVDPALEPDDIEELYAGAFAN